MRVMVTGATGNLGTSVMEKLLGDVSVVEVLGLARRAPAQVFPRVRWITADIGKDDLTPHLDGVDALIHLAWQLQPSHDVQGLAHTNVMGGRRVFAAAARAGVRTLLYASSVGTYASSPRDVRVDERWDTSGIRTSSYSRQKAAMERALDLIELRHRRLRVVRFRPALIFKREAAADVQRLFMGPWIPRWLFSPRWCPAVPAPSTLAFQCVHSLDVAEAFRAALHRDVSGAFNLAAEPVIDVPTLARLLDARRFPTSPHILRGAVWLAWHLGIVRAEPGWLDLAFNVPLMDASRAHRQLGWTPSHTAEEALRELLEGMTSGAGLNTPPLVPQVGRQRFMRPDPSMFGKGVAAANPNLGGK